MKKASDGYHRLLKIFAGPGTWQEREAGTQDAALGAVALAEEAVTWVEQLLDQTQAD